MDTIEEIKRLRAVADQAREDYEAAVAAYREAVRRGKQEMGATALAERLGVTRARIYQLLPEDD